MDGTGVIAGPIIVKILLGAVATTVAAGVLLEGAALSGAKALEGNQSTVSKVAKCALAPLALVGAVVTTAGLGFSAYFIAGGLTFLACKGAAVSIGNVAGAAVMLGTLPVHWKAFQWSSLVT